MPIFAPPAATLVQAAADALEREVLPGLTGFPKFQARVVVNVLRTVTRELEQGAGHDAAEHERLAALLGQDASTPVLRAELARRIESGEVPLDDDALVRHLRQSLLEALAIDNPAWPEP